MEKIIALLQYWDQYLMQGKPEDLANFGEWLYEEETKKKPEFMTDEAEVNAAGTDVKTAYLLAGLLNFVEVWLKLAFRELPLMSMLDFGIIKTIEAEGTPTKKRITTSLTMEPSTCFEALKRMKRDGLIEDFVDTEDKRVRRVRLTEAGRQVADVSSHKMTALARLLVGDLTEDEKRRLMPVLSRLNNFHQQLYDQHDKQDIIRRYLL